MIENKKVVLISHLPPPATGIGSWTKRVVETGLPDNWEIFVVNSNTINGRDPFRNTKRSFKDEYKRTKRIYDEEKKLLKENKIEVVHTCIPCTPLGMIREMGCARIARKHKVPFILHCRCTVPNVVNNWWKKLLLKKLLKKCKGVMVLNSKSYDFIKSLNKKIYVEIIPNFVSSSEMMEPKDKKEVKDIYYVGGVTEEKGANIIIEAARKFPDINFHLIGNIEPQIETIEKSDNVIFYGMKNRDFVDNALKNADIFLFLSRYWGEGFSNALVEAMAKGIPCIVTDWAANKDMIEDKGGIVLVERNVESLCDSISKMINEPNLLNEYSLWNINKVMTKYVDKVVLKQYTRFYEHIVHIEEK